MKLGDVLDASKTLFYAKSSKFVCSEASGEIIFINGIQYEIRMFSFENLHFEKFGDYVKEEKMEELESLDHFEYIYFSNNDKKQNSFMLYLWKVDFKNPIILMIGDGASGKSYFAHNVLALPAYDVHGYLNSSLSHIDKFVLMANSKNEVPSHLLANVVEFYLFKSSESELTKNFKMGEYIYYKDPTNWMV